MDGLVLGFFYSITGGIIEEEKKAATQSPDANIFKEAAALE